MHIEKFKKVIYNIYMKKEFNNELVFKMELDKLIRSLNTNNPNSVYNIFCHHINDEKVKDMDSTISNILTNGLKCNYSTISRTLTYMGSSDSFSLDILFRYGYLTSNYKLRNIVLVAIPKYIKTTSGEILDFSTPEGNQKDFNQQTYSLFDKIKDNENINPMYNLCLYTIDENNKNYTLIANEQHLGKVKHSKRQPIINNIKLQIESLNKGRMA